MTRTRMQIQATQAKKMIIVHRISEEGIVRR